MTEAVWFKRQNNTSSCTRLCACSRRRWSTIHQKTMTARVTPRRNKRVILPRLYQVNRRSWQHFFDIHTHIKVDCSKKGKKMVSTKFSSLWQQSISLSFQLPLKILPWRKSRMLTTRGRNRATNTLTHVNVKK